MDFTLKKYLQLILALKEKCYSFLSFKEFYEAQKSINNVNLKLVCLRHDVDRLPYNALKLAQLGHAYGMNSTYYFRYTDSTFKEKIITEIYAMGHEIGFHYETLAKARGNIKIAKDIFEWIWPRLSQNGIVVFDDYGFYTCAGITRLVNDYKKTGNKLIFHNLNGHAVFVKQ